MDVKQIIASTTVALLTLVLLLPFSLPLFFGESLPLPELLEMMTLTLGYLAAVLHEAGHLIFAWSFGIPALPSMDLDQGGSVIYFGDRAWLLQWFVWFFFVGLGFWLWLKKHKRAAGTCMFTLLVHVVLGSQGGFEFVVTSAGYVAQIFVALLLIWRGFTDATKDSRTERYLSQFFGFYLLGRVGSLFLSLSAEQSLQTAYRVLKGSHLLVEFEDMAFRMNLDLVQMASIASMVLALSVALVIVRIVKDA